MAQAVTTNTHSSFLAQLLAPITPREHRRLLADLRHEAEAAWRVVYHRYWAAQGFSSYVAHLKSAAQAERRTRKIFEDELTACAKLELLTALDRMMHVPAPTIGALRQKQKLRGFDGGRDRWEAAIAADAARLEEA